MSRSSDLVDAIEHEASGPHNETTLEMNARLLRIIGFCRELRATRELSIEPRDVATRMRAIEDNITGETGEDAPALDRVVAVLLGVNFDGLDVVLYEEAERVLKLQDDWYRRHGVKPTAANIAGLGIVQGITFAVAAYRMREDAER